MPDEVVVSSTPDPVTADASVIEKVGEHEVKLEQMQQETAAAAAAAEAAAAAAAAAASNPVVVEPAPESVHHSHLKEMEERLLAHIDKTVADHGTPPPPPPPVTPPTPDEVPKSRAKNAKAKRSLADRWYGR